MGDTAAILSVLLVVWELRKTKLNNYLVNMDMLRKEESDVRARFQSAEGEIASLIKKLEKKPVMDAKEFFRLFGSREYENIRKIGYFYEYMGLIVRKKAIPFSIIFSLFSFPDAFWDKTDRIRKIVCTEVGIYDFWDNFEFLHKKYKRRRRFKKIMNKGKGSVHSDI